MAMPRLYYNTLEEQVRLAGGSAEGNKRSDHSKEAAVMVSANQVPLTRPGGRESYSTFRITVPFVAFPELSLPEKVSGYSPGWTESFTLILIAILSSVTN